MRSNRISLFDENIKKLGLFNNKSEVMYADDKPIRFGKEKGVIKVRVRPNSKTLYLDFKGQRITLGAWCPDNYGYEMARREAVSIVEGKHREFKEPEFNTFGQLFEKYRDARINAGAKSMDVVQRRWNKVTSAIRSKPIEEITRDDAIEMQEEVIRTSTPSQGNKAVEVCSAVWNYSRLKVKGIDTLLKGLSNPFGGLKDKNIKRMKPVVPEMEKDLSAYWKVIESVKEDDYKAIFKLKVLTGMHMEEILNLRVQMIEHDEFGAWIKMPVNYHKNSNYVNGIEHRIYLHDKTFALLPMDKPILNGTVRPQALLFEGLDFTPYSPKTMNRIWNKACDEANMPRIWLSRFRHMLVTSCLNAIHSVTGKDGTIQNHLVDGSLITGHCYTKGTAAKNYTAWDSSEVRRDMFIAGYYYQDRVWETALNDIVHNVSLSDLEFASIIKSKQNSNQIPQISDSFVCDRTLVRS